MDQPDYYNILGVEKNASEGEIKKAYRNLSLQYHPDRNKEESAIDKYKQINEAYEILGDKEKKGQYDMERQHGGNPFGHAGHPGADFQDINNIFNMMFNGMQGGMPGGMPGQPNVRIFTNSQMPGSNPFHTNLFQQIQRPSKIQKKVIISLEDSYKGITVPVELSYVVVQHDEQETKTETIYITIPPGIDENESIDIRDKGNTINGMCGGIKIIIGIGSHPYFKRRGLDIHYTHSITLKEALTGFRLEIMHLSGKKIGLNNIENPNVINPGYVKIATGYGMNRENTTGNLLIEFNIHFPESLTDEQREILLACL